MTRISVILATSVLAVSAALAQTAPVPAMDQSRAVTEAAAPRTEAQGQSGEGDCPAPDTVAAPATAPQPNAGNTGWSGGTGGSQLGTNAQGALPASPTWQPPTARGLDLTGRAEPVALRAPDC